MSPPYPPAPLLTFSEAAYLLLFDFFHRFSKEIFLLTRNPNVADDLTELLDSEAEELGGRTEEASYPVRILLPTHYQF